MSELHLSIKGRAACAERVRPMTPREIAMRVRDIGAYNCSGGNYGTPECWDYEAAHADEDRLWRDVLRAIAEGWCEDPAACARAALESQDLEFKRACG